MVDASQRAPVGRLARRRSRARVLLAIILVIPLGMLVRQLPGEVGNLAAGACFPVLFALLIWTVAPRVRGPICAVAAFAIAATIEVAQLTPVPALLTAAFPPAYWLVGTTFAPLDLVGYALGAVLVVPLGVALTRPSGPDAAGRPPATLDERSQ